MKESHFSLANYCPLIKCKEKLCAVACLFIFFLTSLNGIRAQVVSVFSSSGTYTVPPEVTAIRVEAWGGGGAGGGASALIAASVGGGGGGGGAYNTDVFSVTSSQVYTVTVGSGGASNGASGGITSVTGTGGTISANGGAGGGDGSKIVLVIPLSQGEGGAGGAGGLYDGGAGKTAVSANSGAGGGGGGNGGAGSASVSGTTGGIGGAGTYAGGNGADSFVSTSDGANGSVPGGGGSGARVGGVLSTKLGGHGGNGLVRITAYRCYSGFNTTWNGTSWSNGTPNKEKVAIISANYNTATHGNITACSCQINTGNTLTVGNGTNSNYLELYNELINNGTIIVANNSSLVQWYNSVSNTNTGTLKINKNAKPMKRYDFTYWSSPVNSQNLNAFSPNTLSDKYYSYDPTTGWIIHHNGATTMQVGRGYAVRAPQSFPTNTTDNFTGVFTGAPNNGEKIVSGFQGSATADVYNLIGNPYPSTVNIDLFLTDPENSELDGTIYLWTHNTPPNALSGSTQYSYSSSDYASYNLSGGVAVALPAVNVTMPLDPTDSDDNMNAPTKYIASGQAFFIRGLKQFDDVATSSPPIIKFKNSMRVAGNNTNFFKPAPTTPVENWQTTGKHRFWLNLRNGEGAFNQALIGYIQNATDGLDRLYDGELFGGNFVTIYSLLEQKRLTIQGKALPFSDEDVVPLGYQTTIVGSFSISLDHFDGLFEGQNIFLKDKLLNIIHNLKDGAYDFTSASGTFDNRFEIVYQNAALGNESLIINPESIVVYRNSDLTIALNSGSIIMKEIKVYDIAGRVISHKEEVDSSTTEINNLPQIHQVLIIDVLTVEGQKIVKKIVF